MEFPKDIQYQIVKKLDIDTRRTLGIYTKIKCPKSLEQKITCTFNKIETGADHVYINIGPIRNIKMSDNSIIKEPVYGIYRFFDDKNLVETRVHYFPIDETISKEYVSYIVLFFVFPNS